MSGYLIHVWMSDTCLRCMMHDLNVVHVLDRWDTFGCV